MAQLQGMKFAVPGKPDPNDAAANALFGTNPSSPFLAPPSTAPQIPDLLKPSTSQPAMQGQVPVNFDQFKADPQNWIKSGYAPPPPQAAPASRQEYDAQNGPAPLPQRPWTPTGAKQNIGMGIAAALDNIGASLDHGQASVGHNLIEQAQSAQDYDRNLPVMQQAASESRYGKYLGETAQQGQIQHEQLANQFFPQVQQLGINKTQAEIAKDNAEAAKAGAGANLERYKEVNGQLYDVSGQIPKMVDGVGVQVPLDANLASLANLAAGTKVPLKTAMEIKQLADAGIKTVQANGRSLLIDSQGHTIKDLGAATPIVVNNLNNAGFGEGDNVLAHLVAEGKLDMATALTRTTPAMREKFAAAVQQINPQFNAGDFKVEQGVRKNFTSGKVSDELNAYNTAINHAELLKQAAAALKNGDTQTLNALSNKWSTEFGSSAPTNFDAIANLYRGEVTKAINGGHVTEGELNQTGGTLGQNASPEQILGVIDSYAKAMASKRQNRQDQYKEGMKGQPNFGTQAPAPASAPATHPTTHTFSLSAWQKANPGGDVNAAKQAAVAAGYEVTN